MLYNTIQCKQYILYMYYIYMNIIHEICVFNHPQQYVTYTRVIKYKLVDE